MTRLRFVNLGMSALLAGVLSGCGGGKAEMQAGAPPGPPPRAAELDRLNDMVGNWEYTMEMTPEGMDKPMVSKGTVSTQWDCDKHCIVEHVDGDMGEQGKFHGMSVMTWDPKAKTYRSMWCDSTGEVSMGTSEYDDETKTWTGKSKGANGMGDTVVGEWTSRVIDANTVEWSGTQWNAWKTKKLVEFKGTNRRRS